MAAANEKNEQGSSKDTDKKGPESGKCKGKKRNSHGNMTAKEKMSESGPYHSSTPVDRRHGERWTASKRKSSRRSSKAARKTPLRSSNASLTDSSHSFISSSSSEIDVTSTRKTRRARKREEKSAVMHEKLADIQRVVLAKKELLVQQAEPTMTRLQSVLVYYKRDFSTRAEPYLSPISERLVPVNAWLRTVIFEAHRYVKIAEVWLDENLPERVLEWFDPIPEDEKEPFKIHKPSGLSFVFFILNLAVFAIGIFVFLLAVSVLINLSSVNSWIKTFDPTGRLKNFNISGIVAYIFRIVALCGAFLLGLGYLGTVGCTLGQRQMLKGYAAIVALAIAVQVLFALLGFLNRSRIYNNMAEDLKAELRSTYDGNPNSTMVFSHIWDLIHFSLSCCGVLNYTDFVGTPWYEAANRPLESSGNRTRAIVYQFPISCCKALGDRSPVSTAELEDSRCQEKNASLQNPNTEKPCLKVFTSFIFSKIFVLLGAILSFVGLEVSLITNALAIVNMIDTNYAKSRKKKEKENKRRKQKDKYARKRSRAQSSHIEDDDDKDVEKAETASCPLKESRDHLPAAAISPSTPTCDATPTGSLENQAEEQRKEHRRPSFPFIMKFRVGSTNIAHGAAKATSSTNLRDGSFGRADGVSNTEEERTVQPLDPGVPSPADVPLVIATIPASPRDLEQEGGKIESVRVGTAPKNEVASMMVSGSEQRLVSEERVESDVVILVPDCNRTAAANYITTRVSSATILAPYDKKNRKGKQKPAAGTGMDGSETDISSSGVDTDVQSIHHAPSVCVDVQYGEQQQASPHMGDRIQDKKQTGDPKQDKKQMEEKEQTEGRKHFVDGTKDLPRLLWTWYRSPFHNTSGSQKASATTTTTTTTSTTTTTTTTTTTAPAAASTSTTIAIATTTAHDSVFEMGPLDEQRQQPHN